MKRKTLRGNQAPFMTRELRKAIYNRSHLKNKQEADSFKISANMPLYV